MENDLLTAKEAHKYRLEGHKVYVINCPICNSFGFSISRINYCSDRCSDKVVEAFDWINQNDFATNGDFIEYDDRTWYVRGTTVNKISIASEGKDITHNYLLNGTNETILLNEIKVPFKKLPAQWMIGPL